jgi:gluconolactonase
MVKLKGPDGHCYVCNNGGFIWMHDEQGTRPTGTPDDYDGGRIERVDLETGSIEQLYGAATGSPLKGPNDIVFDRQGGFWFTDPGKRRPNDLDYGSVYYATCDGAHIQRVIHPIQHPNGIGLTADEDRLYVAETQTGRLWGFDVTAPGEIAKRPYPSPHGGFLIAGVPGYQLFDSLALDSAGNICVATLMNGGITIISPDGEKTSHVPLPDPYCTNICFGGPDLKTAYVTLSAYGRLIEMPWSTSGLPLNFLNT